MSLLAAVIAISGCATSPVDDDDVVIETGADGKGDSVSGKVITRRYQGTSDGFTYADDQQPLQMNILSDTASKIVAAGSTYEFMANQTGGSSDRATPWMPGQSLTIVGQSITPSDAQIKFFLQVSTSDDQAYPAMENVVCRADGRTQNLFAIVSIDPTRRLIASNLATYTFEECGIASWIGQPGTTARDTYFPTNFSFGVFPLAAIRTASSSLVGAYTFQLSATLNDER